MREQRRARVHEQEGLARWWPHLRDRLEARELELLPQAGRLGEVEPRVGRQVARRIHAGESLVPDDLAVTQAHDGLKHRAHATACEQIRHVGVVELQPSGRRPCIHRWGIGV